MIKSTSRGVGKMAAMFGIVGAVFGAGECFAQTYRGDVNNESWVNKSVGGACAGLVIGAMKGSVAAAVGSAAVLAALTGVFAAIPPLAPWFDEKEQKKSKA